MMSEVGGSTLEEESGLMEGHDFDIVKASQYGYLPRVRQLVEEMKVDCGKGDHQNITPMHWAAINNRVDVVR